MFHSMKSKHSVEPSKESIDEIMKTMAVSDDSNARANVVRLPPWSYAVCCYNASMLRHKPSCRCACVRLSQARLTDPRVLQ